MGLQEMMSAIREMEQGNLKYEKGLERLRHPKHTFDPKNTKIQLLKTSNEEMSKLEELKTNITTTKLERTVINQKNTDSVTCSTFLEKVAELSDVSFLVLKMKKN